MAPIEPIMNIGLAPNGWLPADRAWRDRSIACLTSASSAGPVMPGIPTAPRRSATLRRDPDRRAARSAMNSPSARSSACTRYAPARHRPRRCNPSSGWCRRGSWPAGWSSGWGPCSRWRRSSDCGPHRWDTSASSGWRRRPRRGRRWPGRRRARARYSAPAPAPPSPSCPPAAPAPPRRRGRGRRTLPLSLFGASYSYTYLSGPGDTARGRHHHARADLLHREPARRHRGRITRNHHGSGHQVVNTLTFPGEIDGEEDRKTEHALDHGPQQGPRERHPAQVAGARDAQVETQVADGAAGHRDGHRLIEQQDQDAGDHAGLRRHRTAHRDGCHHARDQNRHVDEEITQVGLQSAGRRGHRADRREHSCPWRLSSIVAGFYAIGCQARRRLMENDPSPDMVQARDVSRLIDLPVLDLDVVEQALVVAPLRLHLDVQVEIIRRSNSRSISARAAVPMALIIAPPRPTTIGFCDSRSTRIEQKTFVIPLSSLSSNWSTTTVVENGSSSCVSRSTCSRTISAAKKRSGWSVSTPGGTAARPPAGGWGTAARARPRCTVGRRQRHELGERMRLAVRLEERQQARLLDQIDLVEREDHRRLQLLQHVEHEAVAGAGLHRGVHQESHHVHVAHRVEGGVHHAVVEPSNT